MESNKLKIITPSLAEELSRYIRLLAIAGKSLFTKYLHTPLVYAGWERQMKYKDSKFLMARIEEAKSHISKLHTLGPLTKRLISQSMHESYSNLGNACLFVLDKIGSVHALAKSEEGIEFIEVINAPLKDFNNQNQQKREKVFESSLENLSTTELQNALAPIELEKQEIKVKIQKEALNLFNHITIFSKKDDIPRCRKLIANYLIHYAEEENNNRDEIEKIIDALEIRSPNFRNELNEFIAIQLYYLIFKGISEGDLVQAIKGIRKYAFTFQGNPDIKYFMEIDHLESKMQKVITEKKLWKVLRKDTMS
ncbi:MAG: hypothetical protein SFU98_15865 [Leptospiraceae bacterium]|nr:hypothetical protein [Leptospiraceae bacterium]